MLSPVETRPVLARKKKDLDHRSKAGSHGSQLLRGGGFQTNIDGGEEDMHRDKAVMVSVFPSE